MLSAVGPAGVTGENTTRVRHGGAGVGEADETVVVPRVRGKLGGGGSVGPELFVVDNAVPRRGGVETGAVGMV